MNTNTARYSSDRVVHVPIETRETKKRVRYASNKAVEKAHTRAIQKFANMFRKLAG
jgi:hypothetical protein